MIMNISVKRFDVAIVGAGPAGSSAAIFLTRKGYSVVLLEKSVFPRSKLCGDFLNPVNWEIFERLGIQDALLSVEHEKVQFFRLSASSVEAAIPLSRQSGKCAFGLGLQRAVFDNLLLRLAEKEGVAVRQGCRLKHLSRERNGWSLAWEDFSTEDGVHATLLIGADGRNSWVAHQLGLAGPGERSGRFVAFQLHLRGCREINGEVQIHLFPGGYAGLVGLGGGMANLCFTVEKQKVRECPTIDALFERCLYKNLYLRQAFEHSDIVGDARSVYPVYFSPRPCYGNGFLIAGDAARVTEPVTGEGVYFALRSGELAAQAVDAAFKKEDFSALQLSSYDFACRKALSRRQRINGLIRAVIHRPSWLRLLVGLFSKGTFPMSTLVNLICRPSLQRLS